MFKVTCLRPQTDFNNACFDIPEQIEINFCTVYEQDVMLAACKNADAIITPSPFPRINKEIILNCANLKLIHLTGAGFDTIDLDAAKKKGVWVANVPGGNAKAVAEYAFIMMGLLMRHFMTAITGMSEGDDYSRMREMIVPAGAWQYSGRILGVYGMGKIGLELAKIGNYFGMEIIYHDITPLPAELEAQLGANRVDFDTLLKSSDIISIHVPLNNQTERSIDLSELKKMKQTAFLVNGSRGGIIDEMALCRAIEEKIIAGAAIDSFTQEPLSADHPLRIASGKAKGRLILTPHIAGSSAQSFQKMFKQTWSNVIRVKNGETPLNLIV